MVINDDMKNKIFDLIESKSPGSIPIYIVIRGSHAYGTNIETSDIDISGVFVQSMDSIFSSTYIDQINDEKNDIVIYEVKRFLELLSKNNPNMLELLNTPDDCVIYKHKSFDLILENRNMFLTKICSQSFGGYALAQIQKAKGQNKKQNWEKEKISKKTPIDFCYFHSKDKSTPLLDYLSERNMDQRFCGLSKIPHSRDLYSLYHDFEADSMFNIDKRNSLYKLMSFIYQKIFGFKAQGFKGISFEDSNDIRVSSVPIDCPNHYFIGYISYNKDAYSQHCKDFLSYEKWLLERNEQRWIEVKTHDQKIDGKNMMHCCRLINMAKEIANGDGIIVKRPNAQELLDIRAGKVDLNTLINKVELEIKEVDRLFKESNLPNSVNSEIVENIILNIRKEIYNLK